MIWTHDLFLNLSLLHLVPHRGDLASRCSALLRIKLASWNQLSDNSTVWSGWMSVKVILPWLLPPPPAQRGIKGWLQPPVLPRLSHSKRCATKAHQSQLEQAYVKEAHFSHNFSPVMGLRLPSTCLCSPPCLAPSKEATATKRHFYYSDRRVFMDLCAQTLRHAGIITVSSQHHCDSFWLFPLFTSSAALWWWHCQPPLTSFRDSSRWCPFPSLQNGLLQRLSTISITYSLWKQ